MIEFAFVFPVLLTAVAGLMELLAILFVSALMEGGLRDASRFGVTGFAPDGMSREEQIVSLVNRAGIGLVTVAAEDIKLKVYSSFDTVGQPEPFVDAEPYNGIYDLGEDYEDINGNGEWDADMGTAGAGAAGDVVVYSVTYRWPLMTPVLTPFMGTDGKVSLQASVAVRNEPYDDPLAPLPGS